MDSEAADSDDTSDLTRAMDAFARAWARGDAIELESMLSPSYTHNDVFGTHLSRAAWLDYAARRAGRSTDIIFRDVNVRRFGDMAVVTGFNDMAGGGARNASDTQDLSILFLQIWRRHDGRWLREAFQATQVTADIAR